MLKNERQSLSVDLADKAIAIKKLLEDNKVLKERMALAKEEAAKFISQLSPQ